MYKVVPFAPADFNFLVLDHKPIAGRLVEKVGRLDRIRERHKL